MKKLSLILAIVMIATAFCMVVPFTAMADEDLGPEVEINGVAEESLGDAILMGAFENLVDDVYIKLLRDVDFGTALQFGTTATKADGSPITFTLDLNGFKMKTRAGNAIQLGANGFKELNVIENHLVVKNGYIEGAGGSSVFQCYSYGSLTVENVIINCTKQISYCAINTINDNGIEGKSLTVNLTNVELHMMATVGTQNGSFIRTGNGAVPSTVNAVNCLFDATGNVEGNPVVGTYFTSNTSKLNFKNCTFNVPETVVATTDSTKSVIANVKFEDCLFARTTSADDAYVVDGVTMINNEAVEDGYLGFEKPVAPETSKPATSETPATSATTPDVSTPDTNTPDASTPETNAPETNAPETNAPGTDAPGTDKPADTNKPAGGGCGGFTAAASFLALICGAGAALIIKKK